MRNSKNINTFNNSNALTVFCLLLSLISYIIESPITLIMLLLTILSKDIELFVVQKAMDDIVEQETEILTKEYMRRLNDKKEEVVLSLNKV